MDNDTIDAVIMTLVEARGAGKSICPTEAAQALDADRWRSRLGAVKQAAVRLALAGKVDILRKGKPVDPSDFKGVYRIALHT